MTLRSRIMLLTVAGVILAMTGCATPGAGVGSVASDDPAPPDTTSEEVIGQGTVLQTGDAAPQFCLGAIAESYPPQCSGPEIDGWNWDETDQSETASGTTWGTFAVQGTWDGESLTVTQPPIPLSLYDPMPIVDPHLDEGNPGLLTEAELTAVQADIDTLALPGFLGYWPENGYLFVQVVYDDGDIQPMVDARHGPDVVVVQSALRPVG